MKAVIERNLRTPLKRVQNTYITRILVDPPGDDETTKTNKGFTRPGQK